MVPFRLTCLGPPVLHAPDGDPVRIRVRKHLALLVYLAVEPARPHRRDRLATLLWPGVDIETARHSLAVALSVLRGRLGAAAFESARDTIRLLPGRITTDVAGLTDDGDGLDPLEIAPFLDEFEAGQAPEFEQWLVGERARLLPLLHRVAAKRIDLCRRTGDVRQMEAIGRRLERIDELSEEATRALIEARAMAGDRIAALRIYDRWRDRLGDELGARPSPAIERLADRLRRRGTERGGGGLPVAAVPERQRLFVGRGREFATCYAAWERAKEGSPRHLLAHGESGVGKTTLVERIAATAALEGAVVARIQCYELERELPFGAIGNLVTLLLDLPGASTTPPEQLAELGVLVGAVRQRYPALPAPRPSTGEGARILFTEGVMALLAALAEEQPVVLVVDDLHFADATSLAVLHLLLRRIERLPLMVLMTSSRSAPHEASPEIRRFLEPAAAIAVTPISLAGLAEGEAGELLAALVPGDEVGPTLRRAIVAAAGGNPMALELLVDDWRQRGDDALALSFRAMTGTSRLAPRDTFRRLVDRMLATLDADALAVAQLAAILGQRLNDLAMYAVADLPVARTMRSMSALAGHRVLRDAGDHLEFTNEVIRGQCYLGMAAPMRRLLHGQVADRLLAAAGQGETIPGLEIAWHLVRADRLAEAIPYLLDGGREAIRRGAPHEADLAFSTGLPALTGAARRTAILLLAEAQQELGRWADSLKTLDDAEEEAFDPSEAAEREVLVANARHCLGYLNLVSSEEACERMFLIASQSIHGAARARAASTASHILMSTRAPSGIARLAEVIALVEDEALDDQSRLHFLIARAWQQDQVGATMSATSTLDEGVAIIDRSGIASTIAARLLCGAGFTRVTTGSYEEAVPIFMRAYATAKRIENTRYLAYISAGLALAHGRLGQTEDRLKWAEAAVSWLPPAGGEAAAASALYELAMGRIDLGQRELAYQALEILDARFANTEHSWAVQASALTRADIHACLGDHLAALRAGRAATTGVNYTLHHPDFGGPYARWVAITELRDTEHSDPTQRIAQLLSEVGRYHLKDQAEILAAAAATAKDHGAAEELWQRLDLHLERLPATVRSTLRRLGFTREGIAEWRGTPRGRRTSGR